MKLRIVYGSRLIPKGYRAWVLYPFMLFREQREVVGDVLFRHELQHVYQIHKDGWLRFYSLYLWWAFRYGYLNIPYEVEARHFEKTPLSSDERALKDG